MEEGEKEDEENPPPPPWGITVPTAAARRAAVSSAAFAVARASAATASCTVGSVVMDALNGTAHNEGSAAGEETGVGVAVVAVELATDEATAVPNELTRD